MVVLLVLISLVGHVSASHQGWTAQYVKKTNRNCNSLQQLFDKKKHVAYKNLFDDVGQAGGNGLFDPNFVADKNIEGTLLDLAKLGNQNIDDTSAPRCHGIKFNSRVGYDYDPQSQDSGQVFKQRFCYDKKPGFSAVAFQSGHQRRLEGRCFNFNLLNVEEIEVYIFSSVTEGDYNFAFTSYNIQTNTFEVQDKAEIGSLFRGVIGHLSVKQTSPTGIDRLSVSVGLDGLVDSAKFGEIGIKSAICRNNPSVNWCSNCGGWINDETFDPFLGDNDKLFKVMDGCGTTIRKDALRPFLSKNSATAICKREDGTCVQPIKGTTDRNGVLQACNQVLGALPDGTREWFDTRCCASLGEASNFGYDWMYAWTEDVQTMAEWRAAGDANLDLTDATAQAVPRDELSRMSVDVLDTEGNEFTKDVFVGDPIDLEFRYDRRCASLEVVFEFRPSHHNQDGFEGVKVFSIYQQPGYTINYSPFNVDISMQELNAMKYNVKKVNLEASETYFRGYSAINFIAGDYQTPNFGFPNAVRNSNYHLSIRGTMLTTINEMAVTFEIAASSGKVWLLWNGRFLINQDAKSLDSSNSSEATRYSADSAVNLRAGIYNTIDISYIHYGTPFGSELSQLTLLWTREGVTEVVPRKYFYNHGGKASSGPSQLIVTDQQHVSLDHNTEANGHFYLTLDYAPNSDISIQCTTPEGLAMNPTQFTISKSKWSEWHEMTFWQKPSYGGDDGPDEAIHCSSGDHEVSFYVTIIPSYSTKLLIQGLGVASRLEKEESEWENNWQPITRPLGTGKRYARMIRASSWAVGWSYSCNIQTMHDEVGRMDTAGQIGHPVVGVVIQVGRVVFAVYSTTTSASPKPFYLEPLANIPMLERPIVRETASGYKFETAGGLVCYIDIVAERFLDVACDLPAYFNLAPHFMNSEVDTVTLNDNLFFYPSQASHLIGTPFVPTWSETEAVLKLLQESSNIGVVPISTPRAIQKLPLEGAWQDAPDEIAGISKLTEYQWDSRSIWNTIDRDGHCPLLDGMYPMLFSLYLNFVGAGNEKLMAQTVEAIYFQCAFSMYFSKFVSCFSPNYYFNENDARESIRNYVHHSTSFWMQLNERLPTNLVQAYENDGHFCGKDGHLVGTPPTCACIGNGQYPNCDSSVSCGPQTQWQLDHLNDVVTVWSVATDNAQFCTSEKSLVIEDGSGVGMYCVTGFCTFWESVRSQKGLPLGVNPCDTPYCVTSLLNHNGARKWVGLTECGTKVSSVNDGQSWVQDDDPEGDSAVQSKSIEDTVQFFEAGWTNWNDPKGYPIWTWSTDEICVEDDSMGKPIKYCVKWLCDCLDAEIWNNLI